MTVDRLIIDLKLALGIVYFLSSPEISKKVFALNNEGGSNKKIMKRTAVKNKLVTTADLDRDFVSHSRIRHILCSLRIMLVKTS